MDSALSIAVDSAGNAYVAGLILSSNCAFGTNILVQSNPSLPDNFVAKYDPNGGLTWVRQIKGGFVGPDTVAVESGGYCRVAGTLSQMADFGGLTLTNADNSPHGFVAKYDPESNPVWARQVGTGAESQGTGVAVDPSGNCFVTGPFYGAPQIVFGGTTLTNTGSVFGGSMYLAKYDAAGNLAWAVGAFPGDDSALPNGAVIADAAGNCHMAGSFSAVSVDFGGITIENGVASPAPMGFVVKYAPTGAVLWAKGISALPQSYLRLDGIGFTALAEDQWQNVYIAGALESTNGFNFDGKILGQNGSRGEDLFLARLDGPQITATVSGNQMQIAWPTNAVGMGLEAAASLSSGVWLSVTNPPVVNGNQNTVALPLSLSGQFFRLKNL